MKARRAAASFLPQQSSLGSASCKRRPPPSFRYDGAANVLESGQPRQDQLCPPWMSIAWRRDAGDPYGPSTMAVVRTQGGRTRGCDVLA
jgi:hypothetical protein